MRAIVVAVAFAAILPGTVRADDPTPSHTAGANVVREDGRIALETVDGEHRPAGLWTALYAFPARRTVRSVRLTDLAIPDGCDVFTQYRWADPHGVWQDWSPTNLLHNGDFSGGAPQGAVLHTEDDADVERWAARPAPGWRQPAPFWEAMVPPGADLTLAASVAVGPEDGQPGGGFPGLTAVLRDADGERVAAVELVSGAGARAKEWRRLSVGIDVPGPARRLEGGMMLAPGEKPAEDAPDARLLAANGLLKFHREAEDERVLFRADLADPAAWAVRHGRIEWGDRERPAMEMSPDEEADEAGASISLREQVPLGEADRIELRAAATLNGSRVRVVARFAGEGEADAEFVELSGAAAEGRYRFRGSGPVPEWATHVELKILGLPREAGAAGSVVVRGIEVRAVGEPPPFSPRPPVGGIELPGGVRTGSVEIRSYLMTSEPGETPGFGGYRLDLED